MLLAACSDDEDPAQPKPKPKPDAGETCTNPQLAELTKSEKVWKPLAAEGGDYWYEHDNCVINSPEGHTFLVQVEGGKARKLSDRVIERDECEVRLNAYGGFGAVSFEQH